MSPALEAFLATWRGSAGNERANFQSFLRDFCAALELPAPEPKGPGSTYCFEKDLKLTHLDGTTTTGAIDLYREECFVLEAKQGGTRQAPSSSPTRGTRSHDRYMESAFGQAVNYARNLPQRPPFVITCDVGHAFHIWDGFSGSYGGYGARRSYSMEDLRDPAVQAHFRALWLDPVSLDPARSRTTVTREVAVALGGLARSLETRFSPEAVAHFLMRVVFTFFAEDVGLLPERLFQDALEGPWHQNPGAFPKGMETLWEAMNTGGFWGPQKVLRFNGGLFQESAALALTQAEIARLASAAAYNWSEVDPSIFGTLLESALDARERHQLGAHYTPRAFVERLLRPTLEEPLRAEWDLAQAEAMALLGTDPTQADQAKARLVLHDFQRHLAQVTVLDPACGSGNFLATAYDVLKRIEGEVQRRLEDLGETGRALALEGVLVTPAQFVGLEVKPWAAAITDLVLWISHLQWFHRQHPDLAPPEPVLQAYGNIQCRDAVLTWSAKRETDRSRWDGQTFQAHRVTGKQVPDETAQVPIFEYLDPLPASWPKADFIVGNPPFLHGPYMRERLGDGYIEALRKAYGDLPEGIDFVGYWWHKAAEIVRQGKARRFGFITTNSLGQPKNRRLLAPHLDAAENPLRLLWVIPDHPWADEGAAVRIAMTVGGMEGRSWLGKVTREPSRETAEGPAEDLVVEGSFVERIHEDLHAGARVASARPLRSNLGLTFQGLIPLGEGFLVTPGQWEAWGKPAIVKPYRNGRDITSEPRNRMVIDTFGLDEAELRARWPAQFQHLFDSVKPFRDKDNRPSRRDRWWRFAEPVPLLRAALEGLPRYIVTSMTAKHRVFTFLGGGTLPDQKLIAFALSDAYALGVLSSSIHGAWASPEGAASTLEDRPVYAHSVCFNPFPFPEASEVQKQTIRDLAERLDAHRKAAQEHGLTITQMYNLLQKLRAGEAFTPKEREQHGAIQTNILGMLHDELDGAVLDAYGWPSGMEAAEVRERLVALNEERIAEESRGLVRWLRPEYQAPQLAQPVAIPMFNLETTAKAEAMANLDPQPWPRDLKPQLAALRSVIQSSGRLWTLESVAQAFRSRGRFRDGIASHLDLLADLGMLSRVDTPEGPRWHRPQAMGA
jgi:hypothetical protein